MTAPLAVLLPLMTWLLPPEIAQFRIHSSMLALLVAFIGTMGIIRQPPVPLTLSQSDEKLLSAGLNCFMPLALKPITPMLAVTADASSDLIALYRAHCSTAPAVPSRLVGAVPVPSTLTTPVAVMLQRWVVTLAEKLAALSRTSSTLGASVPAGVTPAKRSMSAALACTPASTSVAASKAFQ